MERAEGIAAGDYQSLFLEAYDNENDIDVGNSNSYVVEQGIAKFVKRIDIDDFETYADTPALRAIWNPNDPANLPNSLETSGGYDDGQYMKISFIGLGASGDRIQKDYGSGSTQDWSNFDNFTIALKGTGLTNIVELIIQFEDANGNLATRNGIYVVPSGPWSIVSYPFSQFTVAAGFRWWEVRYIRFICGTVVGADTGSWDIDVITSDIKSQFVQSSLIDPLDAIGTPGSNGWSLAPGVITPVATDPREGSGNFQIPVPATGNFTLTRDWPGSGTYAPDISSDSVVRLWVRHFSGSYTVNEIWLTLEDESGNRIRVSGTDAPSFSSLFNVWYPISWPMSSFAYIVGSSFNFNQVVKIELQTNGIAGGPGVVEFDFFQSGDGTVILEDQKDIGSSFSEIKAYAPHAGSEKFYLDISGFGTPGFNLSQKGGANYTFGIKVGGVLDFGQWISQTNVSNKLQFRLVGIASPGSIQTKVSGVSILWRN